MMGLKAFYISEAVKVQCEDIGGLTQGWFNNLS